MLLRAAQQRTPRRCATPMTHCFITGRCVHHRRRSSIPRLRAPLAITVPSRCYQPRLRRTTNRGAEKEKCAKDIRARSDAMSYKNASECVPRGRVREALSPTSDLRLRARRCGREMRRKMAQSADHATAPRPYAMQYTYAPAHFRVRQRWRRRLMSIVLPAFMSSEPDTGACAGAFFAALMKTTGSPAARWRGRRSRRRAHAELRAADAFRMPRYPHSRRLPDAPSTRSAPYRVRRRTALPPSADQRTNHHRPPRPFATLLSR